MYELICGKKEMPLLSFTFTRDVACGSLIRLRPNAFKMVMKSYIINSSKLGDEEISPCFQSADANFDDVTIWGYFSQARPLAEYVLPRDVKAGEVFTVDTVQTRPTVMADLTCAFILEVMNAHEDINGEPVSQSIELISVAAEPSYIDAYLKCDGRLLVQHFDQFGNPAKCDAKTFTLTYGDKTETVEAQAIDRANVYTLPTDKLTRVTVTDDKGRTATSNYFPVVFGKNIYFGEFHWHCEFSSDGQRPLYNALTSAQHQLGLDFAGNGDHIWREGVYTNTALTIKDQGKVFEDVRAQADGKFALIAGAEANGCRGHINIYARSIDEFNRTMTATPDKITLIGENPRKWPLRQINDAIEAEGARAMLIPHHPNTDSTPYVGSDGLPAWGAFPWPGNGNAFKHVRQVEIVQGSGSFETEEYQEGWCMNKNSGARGGAARTALIKGFKLGFCGCSDNHCGWPTSSAGHGGRAVGVTGVLADELTDEAIFDNMYDRHSYATSGARIVGAARMNGELIGTHLYLEPGAPRVMEIEIHGTAPIECVEIIHAGFTFATLEVDGSADFYGTWQDDRPGRPFSDAWYYVRARQTDGSCVWFSPFYVDLPEDK